MENDSLSQQELKNALWKSICDWLDNNPLYLIIPGVLYICSGTLISVLYDTPSYCIVMLVSGVFGFVLIRWYIKEFFCAIKRQQEKNFHQKSVH
jgi:hypothetical protein